MDLKSLTKVSNSDTEAHIVRGTTQTASPVQWAWNSSVFAGISVPTKSTFEEYQHSPECISGRGIESRHELQIDIERIEVEHRVQIKVDSPLEIDHGQPFSRQDQKQHLQQHTQQHQELQQTERLNVKPVPTLSKITKVARHWKCPISQCNFGFFRLCDLQSHVVIHHPGESRDFPYLKKDGKFFCDKCGANLPTKKSLHYHVTTCVHNNNNNYSTKSKTNIGQQKVKRKTKAKTKGPDFFYGTNFQFDNCSNNSKDDSKDTSVDSSRDSSSMDTDSSNNQNNLSQGKFSVDFLLN